MLALDDLDDEQLHQVLQYVYTMLDETGDEAVTDDDLAATAEAERGLLLDVARQWNVVAPPGPAPSARDVLEAFASAMPEIVPVVEAGAARARRVGSLPASDLALNILVIATSIALLRPRINVRRSNKGEDRNLEIKAEAGGGKALEGIVATALRFVGRSPDIPPE